MEEKLKIEIANLNKELLSDKEKFNERLYDDPIGLLAYNNAMYTLSCSSHSPYESAHKFYDIYSGLFNCAKYLKASHPEDKKEVFNENLKKFCIKDKKIRSYMIGHLHIPTEDSITEFANNIVYVYDTLEYLEFNEIIEKENLIQEKNEELSSLLRNTYNFDSNSDSIFDSFIGSIMDSIDVHSEDFDVIASAAKDIAKDLANKGSKQLVKIASSVIKNITDKKE